MTLKQFVKWVIVVGFFCMLVVSSGCKKYPDGPLFSLYTKEHRIIDEWEVEYFSIDDYDSTAYLKNLPLYGNYLFSSEKRDNYFTYNSLGNKRADTNKYYSATGSWEFTNHKESISINSNSTHIGRHFSLGAFAADEVTWEIRRLKEKELWLKCNYQDGRTYFVKFKLLAN